jgi:hypothetical protein
MSQSFKYRNHPVSDIESHGNRIYYANSLPVVLDRKCYFQLNFWSLIYISTNQRRQRNILLLANFDRLNEQVGPLCIQC